MKDLTLYGKYSNNVFTCGELNQLTFSSNKYSDVSSLPQNTSFIQYDRNNKVSEVCAFNNIILNINNKEFAKKNKSNENIGTFKIKTSSKVLKLTDPDVLYRNLSMNSNNFYINNNLASDMYNLRYDGIYISSECVENLIQKYNTEEGIFKNRPELVDSLNNLAGQVFVFNKDILINEKNAKKEKSPRAFYLSEEMKDLSSKVHNNVDRYISFLYNLESKKYIDIDYYDNGEIKYINSSGKDITNEVKENIDKLSNSIEEFSQKYNHTKTELHISHDSEEISNCAPMSNAIYLSSFSILSDYYALLDSDSLSEEVKKQLTIEDVGKLVYLHELGHCLNNDAFSHFEFLQQKSEYSYREGLYYISKSDYKKYTNFKYQDEQLASDFALNELGYEEKNKEVLGAFLATYHKERLNYIKNYDSGDFISSFNREFKII